MEFNFKEIISKEKGLNSVKTHFILSILLDYVTEETVWENRFSDDSKETKVEYIKRLHVTEAVQKALNIIDTHTVNGWINNLLAHEYIIKNPHTSLSSVKQIYKPTPDTRYFVNREKITSLFKEHEKIIQKYYLTHTHIQTKQCGLSEFNSNGLADKATCNSLRSSDSVTATSPILNVGLDTEVDKELTQNIKS